MRITHVPVSHRAFTSHHTFCRVFHPIHVSIDHHHQRRCRVASPRVASARLPVSLATLRSRNIDRFRRILMKIPTRSILIVFTRVIFERHHRVRARSPRLPDLVFEAPSTRTPPSRSRGFRGSRTVSKSSISSFHPLSHSDATHHRAEMLSATPADADRSRGGGGGGGGPGVEVAGIVHRRLASRSPRPSSRTSRTKERRRYFPSREHRRRRRRLSARARASSSSIEGARACAFRGMSARALSRVRSRSFTDGRTDERTNGTSTKNKNEPRARRLHERATPSRRRRRRLRSRRRRDSSVREKSQKSRCARSVGHETWMDSVTGHESRVFP